MEARATEIKRSLIKQLEKKGIAIPIMPRFIEDLRRSLSGDPSLGLTQVNSHLHFMGWDGVNIDYHTFELAKAYFENDGIIYQA